MEKLPAIELLLHFLCLLILVSVRSSNGHLINCLASDGEALMDFKTGLQDHGNVLSSWRGRNCCQWHGIQCDNNTGEVVTIDLHNPFPYPMPPSFSRYGPSNLSGEIRPSLMKLKSLRHLDLSLNTFNGIPIPQFLGSLKNLEYLNLSHAGFGGLIPPHLGNLSRLEVLSLKNNVLDLDGYLDFHASELHVDNFQWISGLVSLDYLAMDGVNLSSLKKWVGALNQLPSIVELHLSRCKLSGDTLSPASLNFTSLSVVDLSYNNFHSKIPDWLLNVSSLQYIDMTQSSLHGRIPLGLGEMPYLLLLILNGNSNLTGNCSQLFRKGWEKIKIIRLRANKVYGELPSSLGNMTSLMLLHLDSNAIEGGIPRSIGKLSYLVDFSLSRNKMTGSLPKILQGEKSCPFRNPLSNLKYLDLSNNKLGGKIPHWLGQLENLVELDLSHNLLKGPIPASIGLLSNLSTLKLGNNELNGTVPENFGQLSNLLLLDVSSNQLTGTISEIHLLKMSKLTFLVLSSNSFIVNVNSSNWMPPFQVLGLGMSSCVLGPLFPTWLQSQNEVIFLDLSNASISDSIPNWFWNSMPNLGFLSLSHNNFFGQLPELTVEMSHFLYSIDLSSNRFTGRIPSSIANCPSLTVLDLSNNNLYGAIPNSLGQLQKLQVLHLNDNQLSGKLPSSLIKLSNLVTMDLGNNRLSGVIPTWIGNGFSHLMILNLRPNSFFGEIPSELSKLSSLQVLDLAENDLRGNIPSSIGDLKAMAQENINEDFKYVVYRDVTYHDRLVVKTKGQSLTYTETLPLVTSIDLSGNNLSERLPQEITKLSGLMYLNLSRNHITGNVHGNVSDMHQLQSLDLSSNQLTGTIPQSLSSLSFLAYLNLSYNNLSGVIPYKGQLTTFEASSFVGNPGLYGCPLPVKCLHNNDNPSGGSNNDGDGDGDDDGGLNDKWFYLSLGVGFAAGLLLPSLILVMKRNWSDVYFDFVEDVIVRFLVWMHKRRLKNHGREIKPHHKK
ncbi:receptor-like protein EIX2 [Prosopis cineraria]|uniref:receptor-like protein EIX2 n=1 Tax=Prosopis cineraria TaxID=364024 RepID=UPI0024108316|nr:receptor-like protein EIX2 [Prosopis cineraria]